MGMAVVHRIISVESDNDKGICYLYTRLNDSTRSVIKVRTIYEVLVGIEHMGATTMALIGEILAPTNGSVRMRRLGTTSMYYRGDRPALLFECTSYRAYCQIIKKVQFDSSKGLFLCDSYSSPEDKTLRKYGIYGSVYVAVSEGSIRPATTSEQFHYVPKVAGIDMEMLTLNPVDPTCEVYMAAYSDETKSIVIYTSSYLFADVANRGNTSYIRVDTKAEAMLALSRVIDQESPDIITGYNLYNADIPIIYFTMRRELLEWSCSREGPRPYFHSTRKMVKRFVDSDSGTSIRIPGIHVVDMYPYLEEVLSRDDHKSLRLGDVSEHFLGEGKDPLTYRELTRIYYSGTPEEKATVMDYCAKDALLPVKLYKHFGVWEFHTAMYAICGTDPDRLMSKGMVDTTYGICSTEATSKGILMDFPNKHIFKPSGGFVMSSVSGYYTNVYCLDVESMYPNITIQHNIDSCTYVAVGTDIVSSATPRYYYLVSEDDTHILVDSRGRYHGFKVSATGILPSVLKGLLSRRKQVKATAKLCVDPIEKGKLLAEDQALKKSANSACGATGEQTPGNPMSNCLLNDVITTTGRRIISTCRDMIQQIGGNVIYGDTDSIFVTYDGDIGEVMDTLHNSLPLHIRFKLEYIADRFIMGKKKHYAYKVGDTIKVVGYKGDKSSSCIAVQVAFRGLARVLLEEGPDEAFSAYETLVRNCCNETNLDIDQFSWNIRYSGKVYAPGTHKHMLMEQLRSRGVEIVPGNSIEVTYVMRATDYLLKYGRPADFTLPDYGSSKYELIYTLEEINRRVDLIDVEAVFDSQCKGVLVSMIRAYQGAS